MVKYVTISVPERVKKILEKAKGEEEWGVFLLRIYEEYRRLRKMVAFKELRRMLTEEDLDSIEKSVKEFRKNFRLR